MAKTTQSTSKVKQIKNLKKIDLYFKKINVNPSQHKDAKSTGK